MAKKNLLGKIFGMAGFTLVSRVLGLCREMTKAAFLGTSRLADAFSVAFMIPNLFRRLFAENSMTAGFIPTFRGILNEGDESGTREFLSSILTLTVFLTSTLVAAGMIFAPQIASLIARRRDFDIYETAVLTRIMSPYLIFISVAAIFQGILNTYGRFNESAFTPILLNLIVISCTFLLSRLFTSPARAMAIGFLLGGFAQAAFQLPFVRKVCAPFGFAGIGSAFSNRGTRKVISLVAPTILGMAAYQLNDLVSTGLAASAGEGVISAIQYSIRLQELILGVFAVSVGTVILPDLTALAKKKSWGEFSEILQKSIKLVALITIPITFYALIFGREIVVLVFRVRSFDESSVALTLSAFRFHIAGIFFLAVNRVVSPSFYACEDTKSPTFAGIASFAVNIALAWILVSPFKGAGIAAALSVSGVFNTIFLAFYLSHSPKIRADIKTIAPSAALYAMKIALFSVAASVPALFLRRAFAEKLAGFNRLVSAGIPLAVGAFCFAAVGAALLILSRDEFSPFAKKQAKSKNFLTK